MKSNIHSIKDENGSCVTNPCDVEVVIVNHFKKTLAPANAFSESPNLVEDNISCKLSQENASTLCDQVSDEEIINAVKLANTSKALGPDGFNAFFIKICWPIIGEDICVAIKDFFRSNQLLKQVKNNFIALIRKCEDLVSPKDFRPISLANELYKIISRILVARLKPLMNKIISICQSAFIPGRSITNNILLSNDLVKGFHLNKGAAKLCLKIDLSKAFDSVSWKFLQALSAMGFPLIFIQWIMECVRQPAFSIIINGKPCEFFNNNR